MLTDTAGGGGTLAVTPIDGSDAAADLGLAGVAAVGNVITGNGRERAGRRRASSRASRKLRDALHTNDQAGITAAAGTARAGLSSASCASAARRRRGCRSIESRQGRLEDQNVATKSLLSSLADTDFTEAVARFQTLQNSLQATLQTTGQILNLSLLDFLG